MIREATSSTASGQVGDAVEIGFCVAKLVDGGSVRSGRIERIGGSSSPTDSSKQGAKLSLEILNWLLRWIFSANHPE